MALDMSGILQNHGIDTGSVIQSPKFDRSLSDFSAAEQQTIRQVGQNMGISPAGIINGQVVDAQGNPLGVSANDFGQRMQQIEAGPPAGTQLLHPQVVQQAQQPRPQFERSLQDFTPQEQQQIGQISQRLGIGQPAGVINGQVVDAQGRQLFDANRFGQIMESINQGMDVNTLSSSGNFVVPSNPGGRAPQTGLIGSEQALTGGLQGATDATLAGAGLARDDIYKAGQTAQQQLGQGREQTVDAALFANQMAQQGLAGGRADVINAALQAQQMGAAPLQGFLGAGQQASQLQAAQSGALGPQAQAQAFANFQESPGQAFLREQAERGTTRNAAAIGGLGGGRVRQELQRQAMGLAQQDFGNQFDRLGALSNVGLQAGSQISGLTGQLGSNLLGQLGSLAGQGANITGNLGGQVMNQLGGSQQLGANLTGQQGQALGNIAQQTGFNIGQNMLGTGQQIAGDRLQTGQQIASNIGGTSAAIADLAIQYGMSVSDLLGATGGNLANLLSGTGSQVATGQQNLGTTLGNIAVGQGSQAAGLPSIPGVQQIQGNAGAVLGGLGGLATAGASFLPATAAASKLAGSVS